MVGIIQLVSGHSQRAPCTKKSAVTFATALPLRIRQAGQPIFSSEPFVCSKTETWWA